MVCEARRKNGVGGWGMNGVGEWGMNEVGEWGIEWMDGE